METPQAPAAFEKLLEQFLALLGQDPAKAKGSGGFEFESGPHTAAIVPDSDTGEGIAIEVGVLTLGAGEKSNAGLLLALHQLNEAARAAHKWTVTVDVGDRLLLSTRVPACVTDAPALQEALCESFERAESLAALVGQFSSGPSPGGGGQPPSNEVPRFNPLSWA